MSAAATNGDPTINVQVLRKKKGGILNQAVVKAKHEVRVNPCLLSSNKSRPHLSTYVDLIKGRKGAVLVHT